MGRAKAVATIGGAGVDTLTVYYFFTLVPWFHGPYKV